MSVRTAVVVACLIAAGIVVRPVAQAQVPAFSHVFVIVLENHEYGEIIGNPAAPYVNALAQQYGLATNYFAVTHPSLPNYMALTAGDTFFVDNCVGCTTPAVNLADRIEASGRTWTAYMEDMPAPCTTTDVGLYVARHNPFVHYDDIVGNSARCTHGVVPFSRFSSDLSANALANFVWITPNNCNNTHDCSIATGDGWLQSLVPQFLQSPAFANSVLFITWDEGTTNAGGGGHIPLIVASPMTSPGTRVGQTATHYNVLRTIEDAWGLAPLGQSASATALSSFFTVAPSPASNVVIHASDIPSSALHGSWTTGSDSSSPEGLKLLTPDLGVSLTTTALASPTDYVDVTFNANANSPYTLWIRMRAQGNSKWNDSIWVQFADAFVNGSPAYRIGTTAGLDVNLATDSTGASNQGWGWVNGAYWLTQAATFTFSTSGAHTLRIQVREDGVEFDQIVLSSTTYFNASASCPNSCTGSPGRLNNDTTIVSTGGTLPTSPTSPNPASGATGVSTTPTLTWIAFSATSYDVRFGTTNPPPQVSAGQSSASYTPSALGNGTTYFWQVVAHNGTGTTVGPTWSFTTAAPTGSGNIVIYGSDIPAGDIHGMWSVVNDATSPNGVKLATPDAGFAATTNPFSSPTHYVDVTFNAQANRPYTLWVRLQSAGNSKWNDSLYIQFSDAFVSGGQVYPLNSASGLVVNLSTDSTGGSNSNWGWVNGAYWLTQPATVSFATSGSHVLRIQVREDGVQFDQIVLSPTTYFNSSASCPGNCTGAPGPLANDSTIVGK